MKSVIVALLATVAMAAPAAELEVARQVTTKTVPACACINAAGDTTTGACIYGNGAIAVLDGKQYCYPHTARLEERTPSLYTPSECANGYPLFPLSSCKTVTVCVEADGWYRLC
ncbi:uncharacterized protein B0I36DRAFT_351580 [Microdochium trichocladiopsis]|uniref:Uncharacterized protein n=1 Tax=Microdochium trichocladiopsis TaxID=1682393 RepID=A0A9P9BLJ8_9PEZI|nr:uncharacterized protein B0I36DRAFT_351580 [Microdochium trichocladiopsis]KAH7028162.1 hypothetical protein B0I36DRAFT_351580 [Microdochium trichocladiopsis]